MWLSHRHFLKPRQIVEWQNQAGSKLLFLFDYNFFPLKNHKIQTDLIEDLKNTWKYYIVLCLESMTSCLIWSSWKGEKMESVIIGKLVLQLLNTKFILLPFNEKRSTNNDLWFISFWILNITQHWSFVLMSDTKFHTSLFPLLCS